MKMIPLVFNVASYIGLLILEGHREAGMDHAAFTTRASSGTH